MRTRYLLGLALLGSALAFGAGCSDSAEDDPGPGAGGEGGSGGDGGNGGDGGDGGTGGNGGDGGDGGTGGTGGNDGDPFDDATEITVNDENGAVEGTLTDVMTPDYYKFTGKAGDRIVIATSAQALDPSSDGDDNSIIDTVVTLYDADKKLLARNDDGWPRMGRDAALFTVLPADGDYFFTVEDCNSAFGEDVCAPESGIDLLDYEVWVANTDQLVGKETTATGANADIDSAVSVAYGTKNAQNVYPMSILDGIFGDADETHVFSFTPPADANVAADHRMRAEFFVHGSGKELGNGSDANIKIRITNDDGDVVYSSADQANHGDAHDFTNGLLNVSVPVIGGETYHLFVENGDGSGQANRGFYFMQHFVGSYWYGAVEAEEADAAGENDEFEDAETLTTPAGATPGYFFVDGNLFEGTDVDWFKVEAPDAITQASVSCHVQRAGSGLREFRAQLFPVVDDEPGANLIDATDAADEDFGASGAATPGSYFLKLSATSLETDIAGDYYRCAVIFR